MCTDGKEGNKMKHIWMRAGVTLHLSEEEVALIINSFDSTVSGNVVAQVLKDGRFSFDGESHIPGECVEGYNAENGTTFEEDDIYMDLDFTPPYCK